MSRPAQRWPKWKIAVAMGICLAITGVLVVLSFVADVTDETTGETVAQTGLLTLPLFLQILACAIGMLGVLAAGWLIYRIRDDRIPPWEKVDRRKRRRRR